MTSLCTKKNVLESQTLLKTSESMQPLLNIAITAARLAGDIIVRHLEQLDRIKITAKSSEEYFTEVDIKAEQAIIHTIHKAYPEHGIIAEESGIHNDNADSVWIIDPLDGTTNYMHGFPFFSVSIAHKVKNRIEHAVVYDPIRHECFSASRGRGAQLNDRRIRVSKQTQLNAALLGTGFPFRNTALAQRYLPTFEALIGKCAGVRRTGSAALDLAYVASGRLDGFWEFGLRPWDIAAGSLIVKEAGGLISDLQGGETYMKQGDVVAGTPKIFKSLLQTFMPITKS
ncbi:myo-inositol-1(or 4)-monophosphatase [Legionella feeleii]|uniref:Inositol-1-monophosphatase n=2 Tax=Legionella feeleii TaxID=453 RepID=A0A378IS08_9GAMM|nr:myo-inositol-1(or 4)-monophosphatase [Legionella feeleii]